MAVYFERKLVSTALVVFIGFIATVQAQAPRFLLEADRQVVATGETVVVEVVMENMDGDDVRFPDVSPFKVLQGPMNSSQFSLINGKRTSRKSIQYVLLATREGRFTIPPATMKLGSRTLTSNALSIKVEKSVAGSNGQGASPPSRSNKESFVVAEISETRGWTGQQFLLDIVLYTREEVSSYNILSAPQHPAFYYQPVSDVRQQEKEVVVGGKRYLAYVLKRDRLYPRKAGSFQLDPVEISLDIVRNQGNSFFFQDVVTEVAATSKLEVVIRDIPRPAPANFSGAVGEYTFDASILPAASASDVCKVRFVIEGDGDPKAWQIPPFLSPPGLQAYDPVIIRDETLSSDKKGVSIREIDYTFTASRDTSFALKVDFTYFSPQKAEYSVITKDLGQVVLRARSAPLDTAIQADNRIIPWKTDLSLLRHDDALWGSAPYLAGLGALFFIFLFAVWVLPAYRRKRTKVANDSHVIPSTTTEEDLLAKAVRCFEQNKWEETYDAIAQYCTNYLNLRFNMDLTDIRNLDLPAQENETEEADERLVLLKHLVQTCDQARYAGQRRSPHQAIEQVRKLASLK